MSFVHQDSDFAQLLRIVARKRKIDVALVEKDYWVTHALWALHQTDLEIWFKGGTSLSKGFGLIHRFSEDLDLMIEPGQVEGLPEVSSWKSKKKGAIESRHTYYNALASALAVPDVRVERDRSRLDEKALGADYLGHYPGAYLEQLAPAIGPFIRLEVGRARVVPFEERPLGSFVHTYLENNELLTNFIDNRPTAVRCAHPLVTLFEKLDAMDHRYVKNPMVADTFVRHYEDTARIIRAVDELPDPGMTPVELMQEMLETRDLRAVPTSEAPALRLDDPTKRAEIERAHERIAPMFWGRRIPLEEACEIIRVWLESLGAST